MIKRLLHHISAVDSWTMVGDDRGDPGPNYDSEADVKERLYPVQPNEANTVSSRVDELNSWTADGKVRSEHDVMHAPVLDIDFPVFVIPSSTPGHFHLYIEKPVPWIEYCNLLDTLAQCGIIEKGYAHACMERGASFVRVPTSLKPTKPSEDAPVPATVDGEEPF